MQYFLCIFICKNYINTIIAWMAINICLSIWRCTSNVYKYIEVLSNTVEGVQLFDQ